MREKKVCSVECIRNSQDEPDEFAARSAAGFLMKVFGALCIHLASEGRASKAALASSFESS